MGEFLRILLDTITSWWPVRVIAPGCQGVRVRHDGQADLLQPGVHLFIPGLQQIVEGVVAYQNVDCGLQSLTAADGVEFTVSLNIGYHVHDLATLHTQFQNFDATLIQLARSQMAEVAFATTWADLVADPVAIGLEIQAALQADLCDVITVEDVTLDQLSRVKTYRILQTTGSI